MFQRIVVAFDDTPEAHQAFEKALALAKEFRAVLFVLEVAEIPFAAMAPIYSYPMWTPLPSEMPELSQEASITEQLQQLCEEARTQGVTAHWEYRTGLAGDLICAYAQEVRSDLVVLGRRGLRGVSEMILGSISNHVMHHCRCSVLIIQSLKESAKSAPLQAAS
jgi:nucleotide-binding universal stress UspA family protein